MPWIGTVAPYDTITSLWGNSIRDRVVHQFASTAERDAQAAPDGAMCYTVADRRLWLRRADLAMWIIVEEPWQTYTPTVTIEPSMVNGGQVDVAESRRTGNVISVRIIAKSLVGVGQTMYVSLPPGRGNATPQAFPTGLLSGTNYQTGLTTGLAAVVEFGRFYGRQLSNWAAVGPTGLEYSMAGMFTYKSDTYGP